MLFLYIVEWDNYFDIMSPDVVNALRADRVPSYCYYVQSFDFDGIESLRINTCVAVVDIIDISWRLLSRPQNREVLVRLGLFSSIPTEDEVISLFTRALFRPMITLTYQAKQYYENMRQNHTWIGVQLRTGGLLANTPEQDVFLTKEKIEIMARRIMEFIANQTIASPILFVSSDSSDAIEQMKSLVSILYTLPMSTKSVIPLPPEITHLYSKCICEMQLILRFYPSVITSSQQKIVHSGRLQSIYPMLPTEENGEYDHMIINVHLLQIVAFD